MRLVKRSIRSRAFLLQHLQIMEEFGAEIPWLDPLKGIYFSTNSTYFRDQFLRRLGCEEEAIVPYQLVTSDRSREFVGGILYFPSSPEHFVDPANIEIQERLTAEHYRFISCLQVRNPFRGQGIGKLLFRRAMAAIFRKHGSVWGVVSNPALIRYYASLGARLQSPKDNKDRLWIITFENPQATELPAPQLRTV